MDQRGGDIYNFSFFTGFLLVREVLAKLHKPSKGTDYWLHVSSVHLYLQMGLGGLQIKAIIPLHPIQQGSGPHPVHSQGRFKGSRVTEAGWLCVLLRFCALVLINKFLILSCDQPLASFLVCYPLSFTRESGSLPALASYLVSSFEDWNSFATFSLLQLGHCQNCLDLPISLSAEVCL